MNRIIQSFLKTHIHEYELESLSEEVAFEHFINRCIINKYSSERFDPNLIMTDAGEKGLDGVAIIINERLISDINQAKSIMENMSNLEVSLVFIQSKTSEKFNASEIGDFIYGVKAFFESPENRPETNEKMESLIAIKDYIYENSVNLSQAPTLDLYYACCGTWDDGNGIQPRIDIELKPLVENTIFSSVNFYKYDHEKIISTYKELKKKVSREIAMEKRATFPQIDGVKQAYIGFVKCKDYINLLIDSDGKIMNNIFEDNVRDFQGYNVINSEIQTTLKDTDDQARFAILNNGITIVANQIKITGDNVEMYDYQIVNGCQTSYVLYDNQDFIKENSYLVIKIIEVSNSNIADRIIYTTNRQTEVKSEAFVSSTKFHKRLQDFYNSIEPEYRLFYERRSKQYDLDDSISKNKVISLTAQITSYLAMFLNEPQSTHRYYGELLNAYKNRIFLDTDSYEAYYIAAYYLYYVEQQFRNQKISRDLKSFKYHLLCAMRAYLVGKSVNYGKARVQKKEFETLFSAAKCNIIDEALKTAIMCIEKVKENTSVPPQDQHRSKEFTNELFVEVDKVSSACANTAFLKTNDIVHCTVISVNSSFVSVKIKTDDSRDHGFIHISNIAQKYIQNLRDEIKIGEIFQAKIIGDYQEDNNHGWELSKIF